VAAKKYSIAQQLVGKQIVTNRGEDLGRLNDLVIDEHSGALESLLITPNRETKLTESMARQDGMIIVPYKSVFAISQMIIVDENLLV
jgi:sporulation protein YlmC with PRC-barrel domain